jgi:uncharacterized protein (TIGR03545 family)
MDTNNSEQTQKPKAVKKKGPIRFEAIIPFALVVGLCWAYFFFLFDFHLKKSLEWVGYSAMGAEVNVAQVQTSFWSASLKISGVQVTNSENPSHNSFEVGQIKFGMLWDALLRGKIVVNEATVESVKIGTLRKKPGKVKPPEPPSNEPSALEKEADKLKKMAIEKAQKEYSDNVVGDLANVLSGGRAQGELKDLESTLVSKKMLKDYEENFKTKQTAWNERFKKLPNTQELQQISQKLSKVKTKDFKTPQELQESLKQVEAILKEGDEKFKTIKTASDDLQVDLKKLDTDFKEIEKQIKLDVKSLEAHFKLPKIDAKTLTKALFNHYLSPYMGKFEKYKALAEKYIPPNVMKSIKSKGGEKEEDPLVQARQRAKGKDYEFGRQNSYPMFWVKKMLLTSQVSADPQAGNIKGEILNISSNQHLSGKPTVASLSGDFPAMHILGMKNSLSIDSRPAESEIKFKVKVGSYPLEGKELISSSDLKISFPKAQGEFEVDGSLVGLKKLDFKLNNKLNDMQYNIETKNELFKEILIKVFQRITVVTLEASGKGILPDVPIDIESNVGGDLQRGFEQEIQGKIKEAQAKIQKIVDDQINKEKAKIESQLALFKKQFEQEISKVQSIVEAQKKEADLKINQAKKDADDQANKAKKELEAKAQKGLEEELKKKIGPDGEKKLKDLKKKLGF